MNIDQNAPMIARNEILVASPIEQVWQLLTDIERWPEWQPDISFAKLDGSLTEGTRFRWKAKGLNMTSILREVESNRRISRTGVSMGMKAIHIWTLEPQSNGTCVITEESLSGWLACLLKVFDTTFLEKSLKTSLQILKTTVDQQHDYVS
jgi:uncharacterized protein YndB with AHSA1/START domain